MAFNIDQRHAAHRLQCRHDRGQRPVRQHRLDLRRQPIAPRLGSFDRRDVIFQHEVMHRLLELETRAASGGAAWSRPAGHSDSPGATGSPESCWRARRRLCTASSRARTRSRIASCPGIGHPHRRQLARPVQLGQAGGIPPVGLDPVARPLRDQRGGDHDAFVSLGRQSALNAIPARSRLVAKPQAHAVAAELAQQTVQRRRRVGDPAVLAHLAAQAALRHRDNDAFLVNIKPNVSDTIRHDPSPMHEARHRPIRRNPRYLHTVRRVAPYSGGHVV